METGKSKITKIYVFGNEDLTEDNKAIKTAHKLQKSLPDIQFVFIKPNEDLPFVDEPDVYILDTIQGISDITVLTEKDLDKLIVNRSTTAHDYDLGFQLKYLKKLGKLKRITIIGLPLRGKVDYGQILIIIKNRKWLEENGK